MKKSSNLIASHDPFEAFVEQEQVELSQDLDELYLEIENDVLDAKIVSQKVQEEILKNIPTLIKRLDTIFLDNDEFKKFIEGKMDFEQETNQSIPMTNKPEYLQEYDSNLPALLVKIMDMDLNSLVSKSKKKRVFSFYFSISNPNIYSIGGSVSKVSAYCNNFDKMLVICNSYSTLKNYREMSAIEKQILITSILTTYLFKKVMTHELRHAIDESLDNNKDTKHYKKNEIAKAFLNKMDQDLPNFLSQDSAISQAYSNMIESPSRYVRLDMEFFLNDKAKIKGLLAKSIKKNPYEENHMETPMYKDYANNIPEMLSYLDVSFDVMEHFAKGKENQILKKYAIDLKNKKSFLKNLCALRLFYFFDYLSQNLSYFINTLNSLVKVNNNVSVESNETFYQLDSRLDSYMSTIVLDSEIPTYRVDSINELLLSFALGISLDEVAYLLYSQQSLNGLLFSKFEQQEYGVDDIYRTTFEALSFEKEIRNHCLNFNEQIEPNVLEKIDNLNIDWQYSDYKDPSLAMLNIFFKTHMKEESTIPDEDIVDFINFLENHRKEKGRMLEMMIEGIHIHLLHLFFSRCFFVNTFSKVYRSISTNILYDSLMENNTIAKNVHFFDKFSEHAYELKDFVLDSFKFSKTKTTLLRPFLAIMFCEKRNFESLLFQKSKLRDMYKKRKIPIENQGDKKFVQEMLIEYGNEVEYLEYLNKKYIKTMDDIIALTEVECLDLSVNKNHTKKSIKAILTFFDAITQEQNSMFVELASKEKILDKKFFDKLCDFYNKIGETLYHLITANIKKPYSKNIFEKYVIKKKTQNRGVDKYVNAKDFIGLDEFIKLLNVHFCYLTHCSLAYDVSSLENIFSHSMEIEINLPYCFDLKYRLYEYENDYEKMCKTILAIVDLIEKSNDVDIVERMELIIVLAGFMKFFRIDI